MNPRRIVPEAAQDGKRRRVCASPHPSALQPMPLIQVGHDRKSGETDEGERETRARLGATKVYKGQGTGQHPERGGQKELPKGDAAQAYGVAYCVEGDEG